MIFISTAMYCEAKPFISHYGLKKDNNFTKFQVFKNNEIVLIITGTGLVSSAVGVTHMLTKYEVKPNDFFFNIGICGSKIKSKKVGNKVIEVGKGSVILAHKIINADSGNIFYTDMFFKHNFVEGVLETFSKVINSSEYFHKTEGDFIDMEAAGIFEAASHFLYMHQINCIKIVSDFLDTHCISAEKVTKLIEDNMYDIVSWIDKIGQIGMQPKCILIDEYNDYIETLFYNLKLSETMRNELTHLVKHYKMRKGNIKKILEPFLEVECKSKNEGKRQFAKLKEKLMEF